jgi:hypothetical protein
MNILKRTIISKRKFHIKLKVLLILRQILIIMIKIMIIQHITDKIV